jgi:hypothetical protein
MDLRCVNPPTRHGREDASPATLRAADLKERP